MSVFKKLLFVVVFVLATLVAPAIILLLTVDASKSFSFYVIVFGLIIFGILGFIVVSLHALSKEFKEALEEMKMQNAAIAYKLTNASAKEVTSEPVKEEVKSTENVNLNPAEPLTINGKIVSSETIGDFE
mgnify:CR=1 FL=1